MPCTYLPPRSAEATAATRHAAIAKPNATVSPPLERRGDPHVVTLGPGERRMFAFRVAVPRRTRPGLYLAGITAQSAAAPRSVRVGRRGHTSARAIVIDQVTVGAAVTVGLHHRGVVRLTRPARSRWSAG